MLHSLRRKLFSLFSYLFSPIDNADLFFRDTARIHCYSVILGFIRAWNDVGFNSLDRFLTYGFVRYIIYAFLICAINGFGYMIYRILGRTPQ